MHLCMHGVLYVSIIYVVSVVISLYSIHAIVVEVSFLSALYIYMYVYQGVPTRYACVHHAARWWR